MAKKFKLAILVNQPMYEKTFEKEDIKYLKKYVDIINENSYPKSVDQEYMCEYLAEADIAFSCWGTPKFSKQVLDKAPRLKLILHAAGTPKAIVTDEVWDRHIRVATAGPIIARDVAETALGGIIYWLKQFKEYERIVREKEWDTKYDTINKNPVDELKSYTKRLNSRLKVGIIGASFVGRSMIKILKPFGVQILLHDPYFRENRVDQLGVKLATLEEIAEACDVVSVHSPSIEETNNTITKGFFHKLKDGCVFINTARGSIVNQKDLVEELKKNRIYAYIDVFEKEPIPCDSELLGLENVLLTPHISGGHTVNGGFERGRYVIDQVVDYINLGILKDETFKEMLARMA